MPAAARVLLLTLAAALLVAPAWGGRIDWQVDSLFYEAQLQEVRGAAPMQARALVFGGPEAQRPLELARQAGVRAYVDEPAWVARSAQNYRRRWLVPAAGAAVWPLLGEHSLETLSLLAFCAVPGLVFLLLRRRLGDGAATAVALGVLALEPLRRWAQYPLTDTAGLALLIAALAAGAHVLRTGRGWAPWVLGIVALSLTRDTALVAVAGALLAAVVLRDRRSVLLAGTGTVAMLPVPLLAGGPGPRETLAYVVGGFDPPPDASWTYVADRYPGVLAGYAGDWVSYVPGHVLTVALLGAGLAGLALARDHRDPLVLLLRGSVLGYLALSLVGPTFSQLRYELVLVPAVAFGWAALAQRLALVPRLRAAARKRAPAGGVGRA
jgi:hypothetical protein